MSACGASSANYVSNAETFIIKIEKMISDNYSMLGMFIIFLVAIGLIIWYFGSSLTKRLNAYYQNRINVGSATPTISNNVQNPEADNNTYDDDLEPQPDDVKDFMEPGKRSFVKKIDSVYKEYNEAIGDYIRSTGTTDEDGAVDSTILFSTHDTYNYESKN